MTTVKVNPIDGVSHAYVIKLLTAGAEYELNEEQTRLAEQTLAQMGDQVDLLQYVDRIEQTEDLEDFAAAVRRSFLFSTSPSSAAKILDAAAEPPRTSAYPRLFWTALTVIVVITFVLGSILSELMYKVFPVGATSDLISNDQLLTTAAQIFETVAPYLISLLLSSMFMFIIFGVGRR